VKASSKLLTLVLLLATPATTALAQAEASAPAAPASGGVYQWIFQNFFLLFGGLVILWAAATIVNLIGTLMEIQKIRLMQEHGLEAVQQAGLAPSSAKQKPWWQWLNKKAWQLVPIEQEDQILKDHAYDGIRELDNKLPPWWLALFYLTILFGAGYLYVEHFSDYGLSQEEEYQANMAAAEEQIREYLSKQANQVDETNVVLLVDEVDLAKGEQLFAASCVPCHGTLGEGNSIGPNLTDVYWVHGGDVKDIFKTIKYGFPQKGMPEWKAQILPADIQRLASYIVSLQGTDPPNAKEPQGEPYHPDVVESVLDSLEDGISLNTVQ
jgi:cytochrome c oxidase cbb3-type subunit III